jgi:hypothetical protein
MSVIDIGAASMRKRQRKSGKEYVTIEISGDSLLINMDPKLIGKAPSMAIAALLRERITGITATVGEATIRTRKSAEVAFAAGKAWARKRYSGGRLGPMPPNRTHRAFNDSGRMARSVAVGATKNGYTVNVSNNRLDDATSSGALRMFNRLKQYIPELADVRRLLDSIPVQRAIRTGTAAVVQKASIAEVEKKRRDMQSDSRAVSQLFGEIANANVEQEQAEEVA